MDNKGNIPNTLLLLMIIGKTSKRSGSCTDKSYDHIIYIVLYHSLTYSFPLVFSIRATHHPLNRWTWNIKRRIL